MKKVRSVLDVGLRLLLARCWRKHEKRKKKKKLCYSRSAETFPNFAPDTRPGIFHVRFFGFVLFREFSGFLFLDVLEREREFVGFALEGVLFGFPLAACLFFFLSTLIFSIRGGMVQGSASLHG